MGVPIKQSSSRMLVNPSALLAGWEQPTQRLVLMMFMDRDQRRCLLLWVLLALCAPCSATMTSLITSHGGIGRTPGQLGEIDPGCWDSSSLAMIQTRRLRVADSVAALWNFMTFLRASQQQKHHELFLDLAQHFWVMYVDCVLSRAHGLGKRYTSLSEVRITEISPLK